MNSLMREILNAIRVWRRRPMVAAAVAAGRGVSGSCFQAMGLRMAAGRPLGPEDDVRKGVLTVNEAFVRRFMPGRKALGAQFAKDGDRIVGIVKDVRRRGMKEAAVPEMYFPLAKLPSGSLGIAIRSMLAPAETTAALRRELRAIDSRLALEKAVTLDEVVDADLAGPRFQAILLGLFAAVATLDSLRLVAKARYARPDPGPRVRMRPGLGGQPLPRRDALRHYSAR